MDINIITGKDVWKATLERFPEHDVYHTYSYTEAACPSDGVSSLLHVREDAFEMAWPMVIRDVSGSNRGVKDVGSVYGYPGPLLMTGARIPEQLKSRIATYMKEHGYICAVSRLNPFFSSGEQLTQVGEVHQINQMVAIDITLTGDEQFRQYRSNHRRDIKKLRNSGCDCRQVNPDEYIDVFMELYNSTMDRLSASQAYYFERSYYEQLFGSDEFEASLYLCFNAEELPICGGIFMTTGRVVHYHLGATRESHVRLAPTKLLFDQVRLDASSQGLELLNLGGGVGGDEDSLFKFKAGFSKNIVDYEMLETVFDQDIYDELSSKRVEEALASGGSVQANYFPKYRAPILP